MIGFLFQFTVLGICLWLTSRRVSLSQACQLEPMCGSITKWVCLRARWAACWTTNTLHELTLKPHPQSLLLLLLCSLLKALQPFSSNISDSLKTRHDSIPSPTTLSSVTRNSTPTPLSPWATWRQTLTSYILELIPPTIKSSLSRTWPLR